MKETQSLNEMAELIMEDFIGPFLSCWEDPSSAWSYHSKNKNNNDERNGEQQHDDVRNPEQEKILTRSEKREQTKEMIKESLAEHKMLRVELESIKNDSTKLVVENETWKKLYEESKKSEEEKEQATKVNEKLERDNKLLLEQGRKLQKELDAMQRQLETIRREQEKAKSINNNTGSTNHQGLMTKDLSQATVIRI